jgi:hypothetical protein
MVIKASAKPSENALRSSTSPKKTKGSTAIDVRGFELAHLSVSDSPSGARNVAAPFTSATKR